MRGKRPTSLNPSPGALVSPRLPASLPPVIAIVIAEAKRETESVMLVPISPSPFESLVLGALLVTIVAPIVPLVAARVSRVIAAVVGVIIAPTKIVPIRRHHRRR